MSIIIQTAATVNELEFQIDQAQLSDEEFIFNKLTPEEVQTTLKIIFSKKLTQQCWAFVGPITISHAKAINTYLKVLPPPPNNILLNIKLDPMNQNDAHLLNVFDKRWHSLITFYAVDVESTVIGINPEIVEPERELGKKYKYFPVNEKISSCYKKPKLNLKFDSVFMFTIPGEKKFVNEDGLICTYEQSNLFLKDVINLLKDSSKTQIEFPFILKPLIIKNVLVQVTAIRKFENIKIYINGIKDSFKELQAFLNDTDEKLNLTIHVTDLTHKNKSTKCINFRVDGHNIILKGNTQNINMISVVKNPTFLLNAKNYISGYTLNVPKTSTKQNFVVSPPTNHPNGFFKITPYLDPKLNLNTFQASNKTVIKLDEATENIIKNKSSSYELLTIKPNVNTESVVQKNEFPLAIDPVQKPSNHYANLPVSNSSQTSSMFLPVVKQLQTTTLSYPSEFCIWIPQAIKAAEIKNFTTDEMQGKNDLLDRSESVWELKRK